VSFVRELLKIRGGSGYVVPILDEEVIKSAKRGNFSKSRQGKIYPSEIAGDFCPREWVLCNRDPSLYKKRNVGVDLQYKFDVGTYLHLMVQDRLGEAGVLFGEWNCKVCKAKWLGFKPEKEDPRVKLCITDKGHFWELEELKIRDKALRFRGRTDGVLFIHAHGKFLFEFKTARHDDFIRLTEPPQRTVEQSFLYLDVAERRVNELWLKELQKKNESDVEKELQCVRSKFDGVIVLYLDKDTQDRKEFMLTWNDERRELIDEKKKLISVACEHYDAGTLPGRICESKEEKRAKKCLASVPCFE